MSISSDFLLVSKCLFVSEQNRHRRRPTDGRARETCIAAYLLTYSASLKDVRVTQRLLYKLIYRTPGRLLLQYGEMKLRRYCSQNTDSVLSLSLISMLLLLLMMMMMSVVVMALSADSTGQ